MSERPRGGGAHHRHLRVTGDLDVSGAERLQALLGDAIRPGAALTVDLSRVTRLTHPGLAVLVAAHRRLRDGGGSLALSRPSAPVVRALRVSGLHLELTVLASVPPQRPDAPAPAAERALRSAP